MSRNLAILVLAALTAAACAAPEGGRSLDVPSPHGPPPLHVSYGPRPEALPAPAPDNHAAFPVASLGIVRLLGSVEVHRADCPKVLRADPAGIQPCSLEAGPRCPLCLYEGPNPNGH